MKRMVAFVLVMVFCSLMSVAFADSGNAEALKQLLELLSENPGLVGQLNDAVENENADSVSATPAPVVVIDANSKENGLITETLVIGKEIVIDDVCSFTITGISAHKEIFNMMCSGTNKYLVLDVEFKNLSTEVIDLKENLKVSVLYRDRYSFDCSIYPSLESFLLGTWSHLEKNIRMSITYLMDEQIKWTHKKDNTIEDWTTTIQKRNMTFLYHRHGYSSDLWYNINIKEDTLTRSEEDKFEKEKPTMQVDTLGSISMHFIADVAELVASDTGNIMLDIHILDNELTLALPPEIVPPHIGVEISTIKSNSEEPNAYELPKGIFVHEAQSGYPAEIAGIKAYDIILMADDQRVYSVDDLKSILQTHERGSSIGLQVYRIPELEKLRISSQIPVGEYLNFSVITQ